MHSESAVDRVVDGRSPASDDASGTRLPTRHVFGFDFISSAGVEAVAQQILGPQPDDGLLPLVLTPNVDYLVRLAEPGHAALTAALQRSRYVLPDGQPIVWTSKLIRRPLAARLPGSTLFPHVWRGVVAEGRRAVVVASCEETAELMRVEHPEIGVVVPPFFDAEDPEQLAAVVQDVQDQIDKVQPEFVFIGISFPKQQRIALALAAGAAERGETAPLFLTLGASFEMHLGLHPRAPRVLQKLGLEWFFRFLLEPRRLFRRYFITDARFVYLLGREVLANLPGPWRRRLA
jgi:N-acetylglucosaminyldiphosphoundecaprenol N-acetyl-beta-D-mannosaminyltransferase